MKRIPLALALIAGAGTASAALFSPPSTFLTPRSTSVLEVPRGQSGTTTAAVKSGAPLTVETKRAPVPFTPLPKPDPQLASLPQPPPPAMQPPAARPQAKPMLERATVKEVRNLSEGHCTGRTMKSITVLPDGTVHVQC